jgi:single-strand DNA-binding protein
MNVNRVVITGNLTKDPELRSTQSGLSICKMRVAVNNRRKVDGEWTEVPNYFNVTTFGNQAETCANYLAKGRPVGVDGKLSWSEYEKDGDRRESIEILADQIQFLGSRADADSDAGTDDIPF